MLPNNDACTGYTRQYYNTLLTNNPTTNIYLQPLNWNKMKFSTALVAIAAVAGGASAFQSPALSAGRTLNNRAALGHSASALMAATMDGTSVAAINGQANGKRKKTKQVSRYHNRKNALCRPEAQGNFVSNGFDVVDR